MFQPAPTSASISWSKAMAGSVPCMPLYPVSRSVRRRSLSRAAGSRLFHHSGGFGGSIDAMKQADVDLDPDNKDPAVLE